MLRKLFYKLCTISVDTLPTTLEPPLITTTSQTTTTEPSTRRLDTPFTTPQPSPTVTITVTSSGSATAGENYTLECTATVTGSSDQLDFTWLMSPMNSKVTSGVVTTGSMSTLTFHPLAASHAGTYTCRAALGSAMDSASRTVTVQSE